MVGSLPALSEIDALLQLNHRSSDALARIRNTVLSHEHAMAEQRTSQQQGPYHNDHGPMYQEDTTGSGGFASGDPKKRRGGVRFPTLFSSFFPQCLFLIFVVRTLLTAGL